MTIHVAHTAYAAAFARENACLHSQWQSFVFVVADALTRMTGETWTLGDHNELTVGPHSATWTIQRGDGFVLKVSAHGNRGVATMHRQNERRDIIANGNAVAPMFMKLPIHHFDRFGDADAIAEDLIAIVIEPSEPFHGKLVEMREKRARLGRHLDQHSAKLGEILDNPAVDPADDSGRTHLVAKGHIFGRVRLGRGGSGTLELSGLSDSQIVAISRIVADETEEAR
ncbi:hypothetical protein DYI37_19260 [Fulvimarina endophytica]|uniref:Uncharacterized protein n=1 Tax=Fulvimarina endophytica TaxID=2293836 RepID=A0A371WXW1_9HYPH|nr:hypothetical protein [Fulvimarina endophytica]RFC61827.1 hypothetical protein DYI37_19260 [Fulvimarina endophytica]